MTRAVVLARGLGTRMRQADVILDAPQAAAADRGIKAMMPIGPGGRPFLDFILSALADAGYRDVCLVVGPDHQPMRERYASAQRLRIAFAVQLEPRGTADALLAAEPFAAGEDVLVVNGDNYYPIEALRALRLLETAGVGAGTVLFDAEALVRASNIPAERLRAFALGVVDADDVLIDLIEKPDDDTWRALAAAGTPALISMNCWRLPPAIFDVCRALTPSARGELELPQAIHAAIAAGMRFRVVRSEEGVLDLSRRGDIAAVTARLRDVQVDL